MSEAYVKVQKPKETGQPNEIKVALSGPINKYFKYAVKLLNKPDEYSHITIRASGNAIRKAIILVEEIKQKIGDLHQQNTIQSISVDDVWEPKIIGLEVLKQTRQITAYDCILSRAPIDETNPGY